MNTQSRKVGHRIGRGLLAFGRLLRLAAEPLPWWANWGNYILVVALFLLPVLGPRWREAGTATYWLIATVIALVLVLVAGFRMQWRLAEADEVDLHLELLPPMDLNLGWVQLSIRVHNHGPAGTFKAVLASDVKGSTFSHYGHGAAIAWEGTFDKTIDLGHDDVGTLRVARVFPAQKALRLAIPPSPDNPSEYGYGLEQIYDSDLLQFRIRVTDVERDTGEERELVIPFGKNRLPVEPRLIAVPHHRTTRRRAQR